MHQARAFSTGTAPQPLTTAAPASRFSGHEEGFSPEEKTGCSAVAEPVDLVSTETTDLDAHKQQSWLTPFC